MGALDGRGYLNHSEPLSTPTRDAATAEMEKCDFGFGSRRQPTVGDGW